MRKLPDTLVILLGILLVFVLLTWLLPAGEFDRTEAGGRTVVVPGTYARVAAQPQGLGAFLMAPVRGFVAASQIIAFVLIVGGAFTMLTRTGAIDAGLHRILHLSQRYPTRRHLVLPVVMLLFSLAGATFGMSEETLVFVLLTIPLSLALGYDSLTGVAVSFVGAGIGFAGAFLNPFTIGVAQGIAELPPFSGAGYRLVVWGVLSLIGVLFLIRYTRRLERTPQASPVYALDQARSMALSQDQPFTRRQRLILLLLGFTLLLLLWGVSYLDWYIHEITGLFLLMGILAAVIGRLGLGAAVAAFQDGARDMLVPALVIALAKGLIVVATDGKIIDTLLQGMAGLAGGLPRVLAAEAMFVFQSLLNFFVPSGSGQAALTMPIIAPLSDLLGLSRQVAVLAFQFGDGLSNMVIPTSGVTMGVLSIAQIPYGVWLRWMLPLFGWLCLAAMILLALPVLCFSW